MVKNTRFIFWPDNSNMWHNPEVFCKVLSSNREDEDIVSIYDLNFAKAISLCVKLINSQDENILSLFFYAIRYEYLLLIIILKLISHFLSKKVQVYYFMHEPKFEKGETTLTPLKANLIYISNLLYGYLSDRIFVSSENALQRAKTFVSDHKLCRVNLTYLSVNKELLITNIERLKNTWTRQKTFSFFGTVIPEKNPQGFIKFASILSDKGYINKSQLIRAGKDKNIDVTYDENLIIRFPGYIPNKAKDFLMSLTHCIVIPYSYSTQSGVITEALNYGKLIIANDIPAFSYLKNLDFVFIIDFNDEGAILKCLQILFSMDENEYERRYWEAVKYFQNNHSETYLSQTLNNIF